MTGNRPSVLFVCVSNRGKSVMAEGLARNTAGDGLDASSAGTAAKLGGPANAESVRALSQLGIDVSGHSPRQLTDEMMRDADVVVVVGTSPVVTPPEGTRAEVWDTDEPSVRGIDGIDRMRVIRDDIRARVVDLTRRLLGG